MELPDPTEPLPDLARTALVVVDVQRGFADRAWWGRRDNPACEANVAALLETWRTAGRPVVLVRHDSTTPGSPLTPGTPGHAFADCVGEGCDLLVTKTVNSAFHGSPDLDAWLRATGVEAVVVCGVTTNHCCETTARVGANLGHRVLFALDATHTHDRQAPDGSTVSAEELARATATNLHGEFATVVSTAHLLSAG
ncbi:cysteine hydrolase family protein [Jannaschia sp. R86511]|uniref:cysteine hydrolase family protein n=1 Tax=Jannaschia sp. R86511 TaxID=3093853 RepID=UPI0036D26B24